MKSFRALKLFSNLAVIVGMLVFSVMPVRVFAFGPADLGLTPEEQADAEAFCTAAGPEDCASAEQTCADDPETCKANIARARSECASYGPLCDMAKSYCQDPANATNCKNALLSNDPAGAMMSILSPGGTGGTGGTGGLGGGSSVSPDGAPTSAPEPTTPPETISVFGQIASKVSCIRDGSCKSLDDLLSVFAIVAQWILGITGSVVLLMFVWGGAEWVYSAGNSKTVQSGKDKMKYAVMGMVLVFSSLAIVRTISKGLGVTAIQCVTDQECTSAEKPYCLAGKCSATKTTPTPASSGGGSSAKPPATSTNTSGACTKDDDCQSGYYCWSGSCRQKDCPAFNGNESGCNSAKQDGISCVYVSGNCVKPDTANQGRAGYSCIYPGNVCASGLNCVNSMSIDGFSGMVCTDGNLNSPCDDRPLVSVRGCKPGLTCEGQKCRNTGVCASSAECGPGAQCTDLGDGLRCHQNCSSYPAHVCVQPNAGCSTGLIRDESAVCPFSSSSGVTYRGLCCVPPVGTVDCYQRGGSCVSEGSCSGAAKLTSVTSCPAGNECCRRAGVPVTP